MTNIAQIRSSLMNFMRENGIMVRDDESITDMLAEISMAFGELRVAAGRRINPVVPISIMVDNTGRARVRRKTA